MTIKNESDLMPPCLWAIHNAYTPAFNERSNQNRLQVTPERPSIFRSLIKSKIHASAVKIFRSAKNAAPNISSNRNHRSLMTSEENAIIDFPEPLSGRDDLTLAPGAIAAFIALMYGKTSKS